MPIGEFIFNVFLLWGLIASLTLMLLYRFEAEVDSFLLFSELFLRFSFVMVCWIINFGTKGYQITWKHKGEYYTAILPAKILR